MANSTIKRSPIIKSGNAYIGTVNTLSQGRKEITFTEKMPDTNYRIILSNTSAANGFAECMPSYLDKTVNGFTAIVYNTGTYTATNINLDWIAIRN